MTEGKDKLAGINLGERGSSLGPVLDELARFNVYIAPTTLSKLRAGIINGDGRTAGKLTCSDLE